MHYIEPFLGSGAVMLSLLDPTATPFLRWAGGKRRLADQIKSKLFDGKLSRPTEYHVSDINSHLIRLWVADDVESVIRDLRSFGRSLDDYRQVRIALNAHTASPVAMLYLNLFAFNGLWRTNRAGHHNVPPDPARLQKYDLDDVTTTLRTVSRLVHDVRFVCQGYDDALMSVSGGDVVYCDPPYVGTFTAYDGGGFNDHMQLDLTDLIQRTVARGARVVISNSLAARDVTDRRSISRDGAKRGIVEELLVTVG